MAGKSDLRAFTVQGPVQAEIMVLALVDGQLTLTGPCGAAPWYVEVGQAADPMAVAAALPPGWLSALDGYVPEPFRHL